jgi:hypothetical protein
MKEHSYWSLMPSVAADVPDHRFLRTTRFDRGLDKVT